MRILLFAIITWSSFGFSKSINKSTDLVGLNWKGGCETRDPEDGRKCNWQFQEDLTGRIQCDFYKDAYCTGPKHYSSDLSFTYSAGKKKRTYLLLFKDGDFSQKRYQFVVEGSMLSETLLEQTHRKTGQVTKPKPETITYTGYP